MKRSALDKIISWSGVIIASLMLLASFGLFWAYNFVHTQVHDQLDAQKIDFPAAGSAALNALPDNDKQIVSQYAGQNVLTGKQAEVFADHYISAHLREIGGGETYSELSAKSLANPTDQKLAGRVQTMFRGETLRGMLLNAYAFDTMAVVALYAAWGSLMGGVVLFVLALLGFHHAKIANATPKRKK